MVGVRKKTGRAVVPATAPRFRNVGSRLWSTNLDEDKVREIRRKFDREGFPIAVLAEEYGTTWVTMQKIVRRESWKHVTDEPTSEGSGS
jgi:hypothetical protein